MNGIETAGVERTAEAAGVREPAANAGSGAEAGGSCSPGITDLGIHIPKMGGGEDTAEVNCFGEWTKAEGFLALLAEKKRAAMESGGWQDAEWNGYRFQVGAKGTPKKGNAPFWPYIVDCGLFKLEVMGVPCCGLGKNHHTPNVRVVIGSVTLQQYGGLESAWKYGVLPVLARLGFTDRKPAKMSRVDLCVDLLGMNLGELSKRLEGGMIVTRARRRAVYSGPDVVCELDTELMDQLIEDGYHEVIDRPPMARYSAGRVETGLYVGQGGAILFRAYRKDIEADDVKRQLLMLRLEIDDERNLKGALRLEFQLRRDALFEMKCDTVEDYFANRAAAVAYLVEKWLRFTDDVPDRNNPQRTAVSAVWQKVQEAFKAVFGTAVACVRVPRGLQLNPGKLVKQAAGCLVAAVAMVRTEVPEKVEELVSEVWSLLEPVFLGNESEGHLWIEKCRAKVERVLRFVAPQAHLPPF